MRELYDLTAKEALKPVIDEVAEELNVDKKTARVLVLNSLVYCVVIEEIKGQVRFLLGVD